MTTENLEYENSRSFNINEMNTTEQSIEEVITTTNEDLWNLYDEISSNVVENLGTLDIEELYNRFNELNKEVSFLWSIGKKVEKLGLKKASLEIYLNNMNPSENEETELGKKIEEYENEIISLENESRKKKKARDAIKAELNIRLDREKDSHELSDRFLKIFNLMPSNKSWEKNIWSSDDTTIESIIIRENWNEIWKEIKIIKKWGESQCLFRDNNGNYYIYWINEDSTEAENKLEKTARLKHVCIFLQEINDILELKNKDDKVNESDMIINDLTEEINFLWIPDEILNEYTNIIKGSGEIQETLNESSKIKLWFENIKSMIPHKIWCILLYVKNLCPKRFKEIIPLVYNMMQSKLEAITEYTITKKIIWSIESFWDAIYEYLVFCSPFDWSYIKEWTLHIQGKNFWESFDDMKKRYEENWIDWEEKCTQLTQMQMIEWNTSFIIQFFENFVGQPESLNLYSFLKDNPQKLDNLWGKEVKSINLSLDSWINFAFRGIIEMVESRPDIDFPHLKENPTKEEKQKWEQQRKKIIKEYEIMLRNYISKDNTEGSDSKEKTFDKIFFTMDRWLTGFLDNNDLMPSTDWVQQFSWNEVSDYSVNEEEIRKENEGIRNNWWNDYINISDSIKQNNIKLISDVEQYVKYHPNEKVLVCINHHGSPDGSSWNWWSKEDRLRLANISPNVKIWSIRCFFWKAFDNETIYNHKSSLSWFSNSTVTDSNQCEIVCEARRKWLWFHEMEIYTRLHYSDSVGPLTESMEYIDWNTWETEIWKIWLAQNGRWQTNNSNELA